MTKIDEEQQKADDQARKDLNWIMELKDNEAFNQYYMRRLKQRQAKVEKALKYELMDVNTREVTRLLNIELEELLNTLAKDEAMLRRQVKA